MEHGRRCALNGRRDARWSRNATAARRVIVARWMARCRSSLAGRRALVARPCFTPDATLREGARPTSHSMRVRAAAAAHNLHVAAAAPAMS
ncbi:hypothetical protein F511_45248 [Dorcoceras hygrometricum]|uniref:Uncharacterized protein n=1 Tax=Dorcoceras hygrometricum TaxID=472368 RepID=A0A2Z6ZWN5_9LAMI|nr:hypothetical protein F511_45248 [Dorcoceras hygrometricum]